MGNNKEKAITKMSMKLREENAPAIVEIKVVDDEFSSYMERKIQDDTYRFSVLADLLKRKKQGEVFSIEDEACQYFKSSGRYIHMYLNILEKGIPQLRVMVEKEKFLWLLLPVLLVCLQRSKNQLWHRSRNATKQLTQTVISRLI